MHAVAPLGPLDFRLVLLRSSPGLRAAEDLTPWSCTVDEAARAFAPAVPAEGSAPGRWRLALTLPGGERGVAEFTWGLFQRLSLPGGTR
ncbi:hypothetical protein GCM10010232_48260 [Streptomyces amakusaensis]